MERLMVSHQTILSAAWHARLRTAAFLLLALLLATDLALIYSHILWFEDDWVWDIEADQGYGETFQYLKWSAAILLLLILAWTRRAAIYVVWAAVFLYLLIDDSQSLHETTGHRLVPLLGLRDFEEIYHRNFEYFFLRGEDFGELIVALGVAMAIAVALYLFWPQRAASRERIVTRWLIGWVLLFGFFAVGVDMLHVMAWEIYPPALDVLTVIEDGGEMICASLLVGGLALEVART
jgi:hypothetical protein